MLLIKTVLKESSLHGVGVFAAEFIPAGTVIWKESFIDKRFPENITNIMEGAVLDWFTEHASLYEGEWLLDGDNAKYMNHSGMPNTRCHGPNIYSAKDISIGTELTIDYTEFDELSLNGKRNV